MSFWWPPAGSCVCGRVVVRTSCTVRVPIYVQRQELGCVSFFSLCVKSSLVIFISAMRRSLVLVAVVISLFRSPVTF